jgi:hypothetical protein
MFGKRLAAHLTSSADVYWGIFLRKGQAVPALLEAKWGAGRCRLKSSRRFWNWERGRQTTSSESTLCTVGHFEIYTLDDHVAVEIRHYYRDYGPLK